MKDMLIAWLGDNNSTDWPIGLRFVQFHKNCSYHSGIKQTPYKADLSFQAMCLNNTLKSQAMCILPEIFRQCTHCLSESGIVHIS